MRPPRDERDDEAVRGDSDASADAFTNDASPDAHAYANSDDDACTHDTPADADDNAVTSDDDFTTATSDNDDASAASHHHAGRDARRFRLWARPWRNRRNRRRGGWFHAPGRLGRRLRLGAPGQLHCCWWRGDCWGLIVG